MRTVQIFLLLVFIIAGSNPLLAQLLLCDSIENHDAGWYYQRPCNIIQIDEGTLLTKSELLNIDDDGYLFDPLESLGHKYYKIGFFPPHIIDSLFIEDSNPWYQLMARLHPDTGMLQKYCNVLTSVISDEENSSSYLNIKFFDDGLSFCDNLEVTVPLTDTLVINHHTPWGCWLLDSHNDIILTYGILSKHETHFARFGLDGTLKCSNTFPSSVIPLYEGEHPNKFQPHGLKQFSISPLKYNYYGKTDETFHGYELDSMLNIVNEYHLVPSGLPVQNTHIKTNGGNNSMVSLGDGSALVIRDSIIYHGDKFVGVVKYNNEGDALNSIWFKWVGEEYSGNFVLDLQKDDQGGVYLSLFYVTVGLHEPCLAVIKLDDNLNVIWKRFGMNGSVSRWATCMMLLEESGVAVLGYNYLNNMHTGMFLLMIDDDGYILCPETETNIKIRPFRFFPNPVDDLLHVEYSPDVQPSAVELYDLQGRLLRTQSESFESVDMSGLPAGTYTLRMVLDDGTIYSDKVVKQ